MAKFQTIVQMPQKPQCLPKRHSTHLIYLFSNREAPKKSQKLLLIALIFHFCRPLQNILGIKIGIVWRKKKTIYFDFVPLPGSQRGRQGAGSPRALKPKGTPRYPFCKKKEKSSPNQKTREMKIYQLFVYTYPKTFP